MGRELGCAGGSVRTYPPFSHCRNICSGPACCSTQPAVPRFYSCLPAERRSRRRDKRGGRGRGCGGRAAVKAEVAGGHQTGVTPTHLLTGRRRGPQPSRPRTERISRRDPDAYFPSSCSDGTGLESQGAVAQSSCLAQSDTEALVQHVAH